MASGEKAIFRHVGVLIHLLRGVRPGEHGLQDSRAENLAVSLLMAVISLPFFALIYQWQGDPGSAAVCLVTLVGVAASTMVLRLSDRRDLAADLLVLTVFALLLSLIYRIGGMSSPSVMWLPICPLLATASAGAGRGMIWTALVSVAVVVIYAADAAALFPPPQIADLRTVTLLGNLCFVFLVAVFMLLYERNNVTALSRLQDAMRTIQSMAIHDELTGVCNRRELLRVARLEKLRCERHQFPLTFCMIDIDHFKTVNDTWGHISGDAVLKTVAQTIGAMARVSDCFGRYGGEEFVLVLPSTSLEGAFELAERARRAVAALRFVQLDGGGVTISVGVAQSLSGQTVEQSLAGADAALYRAKREGRNRVLIATFGSEAAMELALASERAIAALPSRAADQSARMDASASTSD